jgi:hypothetical protein
VFEGSPEGDGDEDENACGAESESGLAEQQERMIPGGKRCVVDAVRHASNHGDDGDDKGECEKDSHDEPGDEEIPISRRWR